MPIEQRRMQAYELDVRCEVCDEGHYRPDKGGVMSSMMNGRVLHWCDKCDDKRALDQRYPVMKWYALEGPQLIDDDHALRRILGDA